MPGRRIVQRRKPPSSFPLMKSLSPEHTFFDYQVAGATSDYNGLVYNVSQVVQGGAYNQRDGTVIHPVKLRLSWLTVCGSTSDAIRCLLIRTHSDASGFVIGQVLQFTGSSQGVLSDYNMEFHGQGKADRRIDILYDETVELSTDWHRLQVRTHTIPLTNSEYNLIRYPNAGGAVAATGALFVVFISTQAAAAGAVVGLNTRLSFLDA